MAASYEGLFGEQLESAGSTQRAAVSTSSLSPFSSGRDVLGGRGSENKCSSALSNKERAKADWGNGDTCVYFNDTFRKL